jgi:hypothetical protein
MGPTGIEPVTSCLQSILETITRRRESAANRHYLGRRSRSDGLVLGCLLLPSLALWLPPSRHHLPARRLTAARGPWRRVGGQATGTARPCAHVSTPDNSPQIEKIAQEPISRLKWAYRAKLRVETVEGISDAGRSLTTPIALH